MVVRRLVAVGQVGTDHYCPRRDFVRWQRSYNGRVAQRVFHDTDPRGNLLLHVEHAVVVRGAALFVLQQQRGNGVEIVVGAQQQRIESNVFH